MTPKQYLSILLDCIIVINESSNRDSYRKLLSYLAVTAGVSGSCTEKLTISKLDYLKKTCNIDDLRSQLPTLLLTLMSELDLYSLPTKKHVAKTMKSISELNDKPKPLHNVLVKGEHAIYNAILASEVLKDSVLLSVVESDPLLYQTGLTIFKLYKLPAVILLSPQDADLSISSNIWDKVNVWDPQVNGGANIGR